MKSSNISKPFTNDSIESCQSAPSLNSGFKGVQITQEQGQREVFCGLTGIVWLHRKIKDAFFLVIGSRTCAHLIQSAAGVMIFAEPRFATAIIDDRDLAGLADANDELDRVVNQLLGRRPDIKLLFLVGSCPSEVIKLDLGKAAERLSIKYSDSGVRVLNYSGSGIETTFTEGEDACLVSLISQMSFSESTEKKLLIVGTLADIVEDQMARIFNKMGISNVCFFPSRLSSTLPPLSKNTFFILAQPFLNETAKGLEAKGVKRLSAKFPFGVEGSKAWYKAIATFFGVSSTVFDEAIKAPLARALKAVQVKKNIFQDKKVFIFPDSQLEISLARFLCQELGAEIVEIGTPYLNKKLMELELLALPNNVPIYEGQNVENQLQRCFDKKPDLVVCGLGLANPLEAKGFTTKWSIELVFSPVHGFEQAADLAELFCRPLDRHDRLKSLNTVETGVLN